MIKIALIENNFRDYIKSRKLLANLLNTHYTTLSLIPNGDEQIIANNYFFYGKKLDGFSIIKIIRKLFEYNPDLVLGFRLLPILTGFIYCKITGKQILCVVTGLGRYFDIKNNPKNLLGKLILTFYTILSKSKNTEIIVQNRHDYQFFTNLNNEKNIHLILGSGVPNSKIKWKKPEGNLKFIFISRCLKEKGIETCIQAISKFNQNSKNEKVSLDIYGCDMKEYLKLFPKNNLLDTNIKLKGWTDNTIETLLDYHAIIFPSIYREGIPRVILEAMSIGMPYIISRIPGNLELQIQKEQYDLSFNISNDTVDEIIEILKRYNKINHHVLSELIEEKFDLLLLETNKVNSQYLDLIAKAININS